MLFSEKSELYSCAFTLYTRWLCVDSSSDFPLRKRESCVCVCMCVCGCVRIMEMS